MLGARRLSSVELTTACLDRIAASDGATNAFVRVYPELALGLAAAADKRLAQESEHARRRKSALVCGIPLAPKDLYACLSTGSRCSGRCSGARRRSARPSPP